MWSESVQFRVMDLASAKVHICNPSTRGLQQEDQELEVSLGYMVSLTQTHQTQRSLMNYWAPIILNS